MSHASSYPPSSWIGFAQVTDTAYVKAASEHAGSSEVVETRDVLPQENDQFGSCPLSWSEQRGSSPPLAAIQGSTTSQGLDGHAARAQSRNVSAPVCLRLGFPAGRS